MEARLSSKHLIFKFFIPCQYFLVVINKVHTGCMQDESLTCKYEYAWYGTW